MIALWTRRLWPYLLPVVVLAGLFVALHHRTKYPLSRRQAHQATIYAEREVYRTDTLFRHDTVVYRVAEDRYRTIRDTLHLTDTVAVGIALARADSGFRACDSVLSSSARTIRARDTLLVRVRDELTPRRLTTRAIAFYDPLAGTPTASVDAAFRLTDRLSLVARADQRFAVGERPRAVLGLALTF